MFERGSRPRFRALRSRLHYYRFSLRPPGLGCLGEGLDELLQRLAHSLVRELALRVETLPGKRYGNLGLFQNGGAGKHQGVAHLLLRVPCSTPPGRGSDHGSRLPAEHGGERRAGKPIDRVLEDSGGPAVVLGSGEEQRVGVSNRRPQLRDRLRIPQGLHVCVVERDLSQIELLDLDPGWGEVGGSPQERSVVRGFPQAARDAEDSRHRRMAVMSAVIWTRVGPHSIAPSTRKRVFSSPSAAVPAPWNLASSSTAIGTSLIVSSPTILWRSPSTWSIRFDSKRISGKRSTSSRSGERKCASRCSWSVRTLVVRTTPFV